MLGSTRQIVLALGLLACSSVTLAQGVGTGMIGIESARRVGLERPWMSRVQLDTTRGKLDHLVLDRNMLVAQTSRGAIQAIDAESGATLWTTQLPRPDYITLAPAIGESIVAVTNGSKLYFLDSKSGAEKHVLSLRGAPGAGTVVGKERVFVPMFSGALEGYHTIQASELDREPMIYYAAGAAGAAPVASGDRIYWGTLKGYVFGDDQKSSGRRFRFDTGGPIYGSVSHRAIPKKDGWLYVGSHDGSVYALNDRRGVLIWSYHVGSPIVESVVAIGDAVYAPADAGGLTKLEADTGRALWWAPSVKRLVAASKARVYALDTIHRLLVLDAATGGLLGTLPTELCQVTLVNDRTDRLYLATPQGLVQCLREIELTKPLDHKAPPPVKPAETPPADAPAAEAPPATM